MAALTPGTMKVYSDTVLAVFQAGATVAVGDVVYKKSADSKYHPADANAGSSESTAKGVAITGASADGYFVAVTSGGLDYGATLTVGETYILGGTAAGDVAPIGDRATGWYTTDIGKASTASRLDVSIINHGTAGA